jgi:putative holliday junction resolvase
VESQFAHRAILAIDYGKKVTGLATYTPEVDPFPLLYGTIPYRSDSELADQIRSIAIDENIEIIVLGLPLLTDGQESKMTKIVRVFAQVLASHLGEDRTIYLQDETLTSYEARERMKNSPSFNFKVDENKVDSVAAAIILEDFMQAGFREKLCKY